MAVYFSYLDVRIVTDELKTLKVEKSLSLVFKQQCPTSKACACHTIRLMR